MRFSIYKRQNLVVFIIFLAVLVFSVPLTSNISALQEGTTNFIPLKKTNSKQRSLFNQATKQTSTAASKSNQAIKQVNEPSEPDTRSLEISDIKGPFVKIVEHTALKNPSSSALSSLVQWLYCGSVLFGVESIIKYECLRDFFHRKTQDINAADDSTRGDVRINKLGDLIVFSKMDVSKTSTTYAPTKDSSRNKSEEASDTRSKSEPIKTPPVRNLIAPVTKMARAKTKIRKSGAPNSRKKAHSNIKSKRPKYWSKFDLDIIERRLSKIGKEVGLKPVPKTMKLLQENGTFPDLKYDGNWKDLKHHWRRLAMISLHCKEKYIPVSEALINSYEFMAHTVPAPKGTNWWIHIIGVPEHIWEALLFARDFLSQECVNKILDKFYVDTFSGPVWWPSENDGRNAGGNLAPRALMGLGEAFLRNKLEKFVLNLRPILHLELVAKNAWQGNGLREDGCIHHHNLHVRIGPSLHTTTLGQVHNNNYGKEFLQNLAAVVWITSRTRYSFGDDIEEGLYWSFLECEQWLYRGKTVDPATTGRKIDSGKVVTYYGGLAAVRRTLLYLQRIGRHPDEIVAAIHRYRNPIPNPKYALEGNKHFFNSDLMAHQRRNFTVVLRLLSRRTIRPESWSTQNGKGYYLGDGFLSLLVNSGELGSLNKEIFQVYDWVHVPGTTTIDSDPVPEIPTNSIDVDHCYNNSTFVGGSSNGKIGVAAMIYARPVVSIRARKSWHFFNDVIIAIGTGIRKVHSTIKGHVSTTINQVLYRGELRYFDTETHLIRESKFSVDVRNRHRISWVHHDNVGYIPMISKSKLHIEIQNRPLKSSNIPVFSLWWNHGDIRSPSNYSYAILPSASVDQTVSFAQSPYVKILEMSNQAHAVYDSSSQSLTAAIFEKMHCLNTTCFENSLKELCFDNRGLFSVQVTTVEYCKSDEQTSMTLHRNIERYCSSSGFDKTECIRNTNNEAAWMLFSIADPTGDLANIHISLKIGDYQIVHRVSLPRVRLSGKSVRTCFPYLI